MATCYIAVPLKKTSEVDLVKPLKNLISSYFSSADEPIDCTDALNELNKLRMNSTWRTLDKHESSLDVMYRYYDQLNSLETKCPPTELQIPFKWKDAFDRGSFFGGSTSLTLSSLAYEKVCILFNIAAMQSQIAVSHCSDSRSDEGLKTAAKYFQLSSGVFGHLKNCVMSFIQQEPTPDLHPDTLSSLQAVMLAQGQETIFHKATSDNMKSAIIAKIAAQCEDLYADALRQMQKDTVRTLWEKDWPSLVAGKQAGFHALTEYYQSVVCKAKKDVGEELARLQHASDLMKAAENRAGLMFSFKDFAGHIARAYEEAKKDNDFIYHARIPDVKTLPPVGKAALAKSLPLPEKFSSNFQDLFGALLPVAVQQAVQVFEIRKTEMINAEIGRLRENTQTMNGILASLNLPAALEDTCGDSLPQSIRDKAQAIRDRGGIDAIQKLFNDLPDLLQRNKEILTESDRMLKEEEESDDQLRSQFKEKWSRTQSSKLNAPLKATAEKYLQIIENAVGADGVVREKFNQHAKCIDLLSKPEDELISNIPSGSPVSSFTGSSCVHELRLLMEEVETIKAERETIEDDLKSVTSDMKSKFFSALSEDGAINEQALSLEMLGEIYGPLQKQVRDSIAKQEKVLSEIQEANMEFCKEKNGNQGATNRETTLSELAAAHDAYMELIANLEEGTKFYNDLTQLLVNFQNKITDFCFARKTEKEELCRTLQQNIVNQASHPTPTPPTHHTATSQPAKPTPPQRPPPPSIPATTSSAVPSVPPYPVAPQIPPPYPTYPPYPSYQYIPMPSSYNPYMQQSTVPQYPPAQGYHVQQPYVQYPPQNTSGYPYPQQQWR